MIFKNKKLIGIIAIALASILFIVCSLFVIDSVGPANPKAYKKWLLSTFNGSYEAEGLPKTYWQVEPMQSKEGERVTSYAKFELSTTNGANVNQIWINISDLKENELEITIGKGTSKLTVLGSTAITEKQVKNSDDGWFKVFDASHLGDFKELSTSKQIWVGFKNDVRVREIVFIDANGRIADSAKVNGMSVDGSQIVKIENLTSKPNNVSFVADEKLTFNNR